MNGHNVCSGMPGTALLILCAIIVAMTSGCSSHPDISEQQASQPAGLMQDDYVYYPYYQVYYSNSRRQYAYRQNNAWVSQPAPRGVTVNMLRASPSVRMDFHDSPTNHHAAVVQQYPKNWVPGAHNQTQGENRQKIPPSEHGQNNGQMTH